LADIRISQLPLATGPTAPVPADAVAIDGSTTRRTTIQDLTLTGRPSASQAEAIAGTDSMKAMTPLTTAQAIDDKLDSYTLPDGSVSPSMISSAADFGQAIGASLAAPVSTNPSFRTIRERASDTPVIWDWDGGDFTDRLINAVADKPEKLLFTSGVHDVESTIVVPAGTTFEGQGKYDPWQETIGLGTIIRAVGSGVGARWTDIDGADGNKTPLFVAGGNSVWFKDLCLFVAPDTPWSAGLFFPAVKQCGFERVEIYGPWADAGVYLDATWSSTNTTLKTLHPDITPSTGMNEFQATSFFLEGNVSILIKGTTRDPDAYTTENWLWSPSGASDVVFMNGRLSPDSITASSGRAGIRIDGACQNTAKAIQGQRFVNVDARVGNAGFMFDFDRANRVEFFGGYGEAAVSNTAKVSVTNRTGQISFNGGRYIRNTIVNNGVDTTISLDAGNGNLPIIQNRPYDGRDYSAGWFKEVGALRPIDDGVSTIGTGSFNLANVRTRSARSDVGALSLRGTTSIDGKVGSETIVHQTTPEGFRVQSKIFGVGTGVVHTIASDAITLTASYVIVDTEAGAATDNLATINGGNDGDIIIVRTASSSRDVTLKDATGNIQLPGGDVLLDTSQDRIMLMKETGNWYAIAPLSNNS